jgi:hypothetical protein
MQDILATLQEKGQKKYVLVGLHVQKGVAKAIF